MNVFLFPPSRVPLGPEPRARARDALANSRTLRARLSELQRQQTSLTAELELLYMLTYEAKHQRRRSFLRQLHTRYCRARAQREWNQVLKT